MNEDASAQLSDAAHDCVRRINAQLAADARMGNTQISVAISFDAPELELISVVTCKVDSRDKRKALPMFASHCPFCGILLNKPETS